jgi:hypothetical protein
MNDTGSHLGKSKQNQEISEFKILVGTIVSHAQTARLNYIFLERAECDSSKYRCRRYLVWSRYEIIWVKGQTRILKKINYQTLTISFLRTFFVIFIQKTAEVVEK